MNAVHGADLDAARGIEMTDAFHAGIQVNDENVLAFRDGFGRALGFASPAGDAGLVNVQRHGKHLNG
jgi:hypothetical protein